MGGWCELTNEQSPPSKAAIFSYLDYFVVKVYKGIQHVFQSPSHLFSYLCFREETLVFDFKIVQPVSLHAKLLINEIRGFRAGQFGRSFACLVFQRPKF